MGIASNGSHRTGAELAATEFRRRNSSRGPPSRAEVIAERGEALIAAVRNSHWRCAEVLLTAGVPCGALNESKDCMGRTSLHLAAAAGEDIFMRRLLECGASLNVRSDTGQMPLHTACHYGQTVTAKTLMEWGADPTTKTGRSRQPNMFGKKKRCGRCRRGRH